MVLNQDLTNIYIYIYIIGRVRVRVKVRVRVRRNGTERRVANEGL
jgi:hypothetical protein